MTDELKQKMTERFNSVYGEEVKIGLREALRKVYIDGAEHGYQYALQHPNWIPVEERLPKENQSVFICNARRDYGTALYQGGEWFITKEYVAINVTHWMEIIPPRKEEEK